MDSLTLWHLHQALIHHGVLARPVDIIFLNGSEELKLLLQWALVLRHVDVV